MLKPRFLGAIAAVAIATTLFAACSDGGKTSSANSVQTSSSSTASDLSVAEQLMAKYPTGVIDIQSFVCELRSDDEWYRTDHTLAIDPTGSTQDAYRHRRWDFGVDTRGDGRSQCG